jgi:hypothetical protein
MLNDTTRGRKVEVKQMERITGKLLSMMLALHETRVWTRSLYRDIAIAKEKYYRWTWLAPESVEELVFWNDRLLKAEHNGLPIKMSESEVCINVDAGELGYGGVLDNMVVKGDLPTAVLGASSTKRELVALRLAVEQMKGRLTGKRVKVKMDSYPAVRNLIKGGGGKQDLNEEIKLWFHLCKSLNMEVTYEWVNRELNSAADAASKVSATNHVMFPDVELKIRGWVQGFELTNETMSGEMTTQTSIAIHTPIFDKLSLRITAMIQGWGHAVVVVPAWYSQAWWVTLMEHSVTQISIGTAHQVYSDAVRTWPAWSMIAVIVKAKRRVD